MGNTITPLQAAQEPTPNELSTYDQGPYWCEKSDGEAVIRYAATGPASLAETPALIIPQLMARAAQNHPNAVALVQEDPTKIAVLANGKAPPALPKDQWRTWTWKEYHEVARASARAMLSLGLQHHDAVSIFGYNAPEWFFALLGAIFAGGKASGIYPSDTPEQFQYKAMHSKSSLVFVETLEHLALVGKVISQLPYVKAVIVWAETPKVTELGHAIVLSWTEFMARAGRTPESHLDTIQGSIRPGHACSLIYTSGTTGQPKAVMVTHDNIVFEAKTCVGLGVTGLARAAGMQERLLSYLPLSHVAGQMLDIIAPMMLTALLPGYCSVFFARPYDLKIGTLAERLRMTKPTIFLGVPRVWEKIAEKMKAIGAKIGGTKKKISVWAKSKGLAYQENMQLGGSGKKPANYALANKIVLHNIKVALGIDEVKFSFSGAAPMTVDTLQYFGQLGININEVYGMSECTGATTWSTDIAHVWGTVGYALVGMEVKILRPDGSECPRAKGIVNIPTECQGEVCFRGRHIMMGYLANPELGEEHVAEIRKKNEEAIDAQGWLHSGDMGVKTDTGMVKITGRYKELIIGAGGENIAPVPIEDEIKRLGAGLISNVQMIGDKRKYNVALITLSCKGASGEKPGTNEVEETITSKFPLIKNVPQACGNKEFIKSIESFIAATNKNGAVCPSNAARIQKFTILPLDFSVETEELTATLKLKRSVVEQKYAKALDALYDEKNGDSVFVNTL